MLFELVVTVVHVFSCFVLTGRCLSHLTHVSCDVYVVGFEVLVTINDGIWDGMPCGLVGSSPMFQWHLLYLSSV